MEREKQREYFSNLAVELECSQPAVSGLEIETETDILSFEVSLVWNGSLFHYVITEKGAQL